MKMLLSYPGIMDHGRQPMNIIIDEKYKSTFHIYINDSISEIDCISIRESLVTGCIPLISTFGVFKERHGLQFNITNKTEEIYKNIALDIVNKMKDINFINDARIALQNSNTIISWEIISNEWLKLMVL
jgi:hypothetical protein